MVEKKSPFGTLVWEKTCDFPYGRVVVQLKKFSDSFSENQYGTTVFRASDDKIVFYGTMKRNPLDAVLEIFNDPNLAKRRYQS